MGLRVQTLVWTLLPLAILVGSLGGIGLYAYQQVVQSLVESRDQELAHISADRLSENMSEYARLLTNIANIEAMQSGAPAKQGAVLAVARDLLSVFDGGVAVLDREGIVTVTEPLRPDLQGQDLSSMSYFRTTKSLLQFTFSDIVKEVTTDEDIIVVAVPIFGPAGEFQGVITGSFYVKFQRVGEEIRKLRVGEQGIAFLVDRNGRVIYHPDALMIGQDLSELQAVARLMRGEAKGALVTSDSAEEGMVIGYAKVTSTGWGLIIEEPWAAVVAPAQAPLRLILILLAIGLVLAVLVLLRGVGRIAGPIASLARQIQQVAAGDYNARVPLGTIQEIRELGQAFNDMLEQIARYRSGLRRYVAAITQTQEEERRRIARDLHDDTTQSLIAIGQRIELIRDSLDDRERAQAQLAELRHMVTETIVSVRQFSRDLRPLTLEDLGLIPALQFLVNDLAQGDSLHTTLEVSGTVENLAPDLEVAIYRIVQEALTNVRKHAKASRVSVRADFGQREVCITVEDNGVGFVMPDELAHLASLGNFGLMGMKERVELFGGRLEITSKPQQGTQVRVTFPRYVPWLLVQRPSVSDAGRERGVN
jgi:two-component system sensor histidine kinase UhpB